MANNKKDTTSKLNDNLKKRHFFIRAIILIFDIFSILFGLSLICFSSYLIAFKFSYIVLLTSPIFQLSTIFLIVSGLFILSISVLGFIGVWKLSKKIIIIVRKIRLTKTIELIYCFVVLFKVFKPYDYIFTSSIISRYTCVGQLFQIKR
jgi:hypothetical protein